MVDIATQCDRCYSWHSNTQCYGWHSYGTLSMLWLTEFTTINEQLWLIEQKNDITSVKPQFITAIGSLKFGVIKGFGDKLWNSYKELTIKLNFGTTK